MEIASRSEKLLGTIIEIKLPKQHSQLFPKCFEELSRIEKTYSRFLDDSELSKLNCKLGVWQSAPQEFIFLLLRAQKFKEKSNGNFDITLKATLDSMGYDKNYSFKPKPVPKTGILRKLGSLLGDVRIDRAKGRVLLNKQIEFGGFGKGFALDCVRQLLEQNGVMHYYINAGGDIFARQGKGMEPWIIILEHPDDPEKAIGTIKLDNCSIAGSAPNRRRWGNFHHLLNAKTKKPASEVKAIFVMAKTGIEADAYATALFGAGFAKGIALSKQLPVELLIISSHGKMFKSAGFEAQLFA